MRREAKLLLGKALDSLILGIEIYNRPSNRGRVTSVLIQTNHAFEMLLKAGIVHKGGKLQGRRAGETISFDTSVARSTTDGSVRFLSEDQALFLRTFNGLRDAAQHYLVDVSEPHLYVQVQAAVTLFRDLVRDVFQKELADELPDRVLPISTSPPEDIIAMFDSEVEEILKLAGPGRRRRLEFEARLRALVLMDSGIRDERGQPSIRELDRIGKDLAKKPWAEVFKGVAAIELSADGIGQEISIRITKREGAPIRLVGEETSDTHAIAIRRVNELDTYNLNATQLAKRVGLTLPKLLAVVNDTKMRDAQDCYKEFRIGATIHKRYSQKAIQVINNALQGSSIGEIWERNKERKRLA